jgi:L-threonylcarbamoyladenylate synthase
VKAQARTSDAARAATSPDAPSILRAAAALRRGSLVVFPTETLYALGCAARDAAAVERLRLVKQRPEEKGFALLIGDLAMLDQVAEKIEAPARRLIDAFWPGPMTLLLPARADLPQPLVVDGRVGVRLTSHPVAAALSRALGGPIASPSANPAGLAPARDLAAARSYFGDDVAAYLDGGPLEGTPSTLADPGPPLRLVREGGIPRSAIEDALCAPREKRNR